MDESKVCECCGDVFARAESPARYWNRRRFCSEKCRARLSSRLGARRHRERNRRVIRPTFDVGAMLADGQARLVPHDERYAVSRDGRVFSRAVWGADGAIGETWRELRCFQRKRESRYLSVPLGFGNVWFVHRLVMLAFHGPCPDGLQTRHLDGNPQNNHVENLAYGTAKENAADRDRHRKARSA